MRDAGVELGNSYAGTNKYGYRLQSPNNNGGRQHLKSFDA
jgi:hypothetical protein